MADDQIERLFVSLEARLKSYETSMNRAVSKTDAAMRAIEGRTEKMARNVETMAARGAAKFNAAVGKLGGGAIGNLTGRAGAIGGALSEIGPGGVAAAAGLGAAALGLTVFYRQGKAALQVADDIGDAAAQLNVSAEALQELRFAFNGLASAEDVDGAIAKLGKTIGEASLGNKEAADTFKTLGVSYKDASGNILPTDQVLRSVADRIAALKSPAQQAALAAKLLGKEAGTKLLPILQQGGKAFDDAGTRLKALGGLMSNEAVAQAGDLQQKLDDLSVVVRSQLTQGFIQAGPQIVAFTQLMADKLPVAIETTAKVVKFLAENLAGLGVAFGALSGAKLGALIGALFGGIGAPIGALIGGLAGAGAAALTFAGDTETAAGRVSGAMNTVTQAEQSHIDKLNDLRDAYFEVKDASEAKQKAVGDEAVTAIKKDEAAALAPLQKRRDEVVDERKTAQARGNPRGGNIAALQAQRELNALDKQIADVKARSAELIAAATGTEKIFDPATASADELIAKLGTLGSTLTETQAGWITANGEVQAMIAPYIEAQAQVDGLEQQYVGLLKQLATATGWDAGSVQMATFITRATGVMRALQDAHAPTEDMHTAMQTLLADFGVKVDASQIVGEITKIKAALDDMAPKATAAFQTLRTKLGDALARFVTHTTPATTTPTGSRIPDRGDITVVPDHPSTPPRARGTPPPPPPPPGVTLPASSSGGGAAKAKKDQESKLDAFMVSLAEETKQLGMNAAAQKENELLVRAQAAAKEDFKNKVKDANGHLRESAKLTIDETAAIKAQAAAQNAAPAILALAGDKLPGFALQTQLAELAQLQKMLADPTVAAALAAQGLSAVDAGKAIAAQVATVKDEAYGTSAAVQGIGEAFVSGIQGATSLADAITKIGVSLAQMLAQAALFGQGPLGKVFDGIFGTIGGLAGMLGGTPAAGGSPVQGVVNGTGFRRSSASGNKLQAGQGSWINEMGQEAARRGQDYFIPGKATQIIPASASRRLGGGAGGGGSQPILFNISMAGANGDRTIAEIAAAAVKKGLQSVPEINRQHAIRFA